MTEVRETNSAFGQRIRVAMAVARVSRQEVARNCQISPQAVQRWCDGTAYPSSSKLMTFCDMTKCSAEWLLWPHPVDIRSTDWAINGVHIKNIVRATLDEIAEQEAEALPPHQQATFAAMMGQRGRMKPDADGVVPVRGAEKQGGGDD